MDEMSVHKQIQFDGNQFVGGTETRFKIFFFLLSIPFDYFVQK